MHILLIKLGIIDFEIETNKINTNCIPFKNQSRYDNLNIQCLFGIIFSIFFFE